MDQPSQSTLAFQEQNFNTDEWHVKALAIAEMGNDSTQRPLSMDNSAATMSGAFDEHQWKDINEVLKDISQVCYY